MSLTVHGYLEQKYLSTPYLASTAEQTYGSQVNLTIAATKTVHQQVSATVNATDPVHSQATLHINNAITPYHAQVQRVISTFAAYHMQVTDDIVAFPATYHAQVSRTIANALDPINSQVNLTIASTYSIHSQTNFMILTPGAYHSQVLRHVNAFTQATGMQAGPQSAFYHEICQEYLVKPYLATAYLANDICAHGPMQVLLNPFAGAPYHMQVTDDIFVPARDYGSQVARTINATAPTHSQVARFIQNALFNEHTQVQRVINAALMTNSQVARTINAATHYNSQVARFINATKVTHSQVQRVINAAKTTHSQVARFIHAITSVHSQVSRVFATSFHSQTTLVLYNTTNLRILDKFPSRGTTGTNWTASSTAAGDFSVNNVNNDLVEFVWRGADGDIAGTTLSCDTEVPQGVFVDTLAILGHNFTLSAVVVLQGTHDPTYGVIDFEVTLNTTLNNMYYIAPLLPNAGYRYWRFVINDPTNTNNFLQVGVIIFGAAIIFIGDDIVDQIKFSKTHYKDLIPTEGYTNVSNDRALRKRLSLDFKDLDFQRNNYESLNNLFDFARTSLKCLWIPTPQYPTRFAIFGKLTQLPEETHNDKGEEINYIDLSVEVDESL